MGAEQQETREFQAEVNQLLSLMIHSMYSNKEIFLRELISNASDAADKLRFEALADESLYEGNPDLHIRISIDKDARTVTISDNGIGMTRDEVATNIGTIAKSGTKDFFSALSGDEAKDSQLIGQFGVGFYSAFIVSDRVTVISRRAGSDEAVRWQSDGKSSYTLESADKPGRGTDIIVHLREEEDEFLNEYGVRGTVRKFSDHIEIPIQMLQDKPAPESDDEAEEASAEREWETINSASAMWVRPRNEITEDEYSELYKHVSHDFEDPLAHVHSRVEGNNEYTSLLYIPAKAPFDLWDPNARHGIKLYVKRVFIMDDADQLMPRYLRFVRGIIDSDDLPLNVSREILQQNRVIDKIRGASVKKVLGLLEGLAKNDADKYTTFWNAFGKVLKEGPAEDFSNKARIAGLLRFATTHSDSEDQIVSLAEYVDRMVDGQKSIYFITADSFAAAKNSPHLEIFRKKGIEVVLLTDRVDEWLVSNLADFDDKPLLSVARGELDLSDVANADQESDEEEVDESSYAGLIDRLKAVLDDRVKEIRVSHRLTQSPACLVSGDADMGGNLERILRASGQEIQGAKPVFEINPKHPLIDRLQVEQGDQRFSDLALVLFDQALLSEGGQLDDPASFVHRLNDLIIQMSD